MPTIFRLARAGWRGEDWIDMFMLRCVFWLSVMISALPVGRALWTAVPLPRGPVAQAAETAMATRIGGWCAAHRGDCLRDAARMTALVAATAGEPGLPAREAPRASVRPRYAKAVLTARR